jgi:hypothetical protein
MHKPMHSRCGLLRELRRVGNDSHHCDSLCVSLCYPPRVFPLCVSLCLPRRVSQVMIDRVRPPNLVAKDGYAPALEVYFQVQMASDKDGADALVTKFLADPTQLVRWFHPVSVNEVDWKIRCR